MATYDSGRAMPYAVLAMKCQISLDTFENGSPRATVSFISTSVALARDFNS